MFDDRLLRVTIEGVGSYTDLAIEAHGTKFDNSIANECTVKITNLTKAHRDFILTETTPFKLNVSTKKIIVEAGRASYGYTKVFEGTIFRSSITQPPDIALTIKCLTGYNWANDISNVSMADTSLSTIAQTVAGNMDLKLQFEATDKTVSNFNTSGATIRQVEAIGKGGKVVAFIDDDKLVVKDKDKPLQNTNVLLSESTGMVGVPMFNEMGLSVKCLFNPSIKVGNRVTVNSKINTAANGEFIVYKLTFDLANRATPFYYTVDCWRPI